jgi:hypothetical protein
MKVRILLPANPHSVHIMRQEHGWSVFHVDDRGDTRELYAKCTLQEAGNVCQEYWDTGYLTAASAPEHYEVAI